MKIGLDANMLIRDVGIALGAVTEEGETKASVTVDLRTVLELKEQFIFGYGADYICTVGYGAGGYCCICASGGYGCICTAGGAGGYGCICCAGGTCGAAGP